ncbi:hypothetical protein OIE62_14585 [Streptomyces scopuliridis]|uniref:Uncharacterized protein n=2 Tax=Streptomyces scopuliridis TaxID=452529 RepID=A0A2T7SNX8_9ACTN|nr:hypothetical protein [Streptomyces scopuliridis]PVE04613.1 hypothetical protein Y717_11040 [Streptomyces scopuliridis RB72]WSB35958.1 hypothetical protein OG949_26000 [Streptomyces scopuliridis]WSC00258.1 hypothetical protein OG835_26810 [Streptomyces scopuliridis]WSC06132.1 hypothetical protein OIE62_14585 [Streptomyces scopuliridis]
MGHAARDQRGFLDRWNQRRDQQTDIPGTETVGPLVADGSTHRMVPRGPR